MTELGKPVRPVVIALADEVIEKVGVSPAISRIQVETAPDVDVVDELAFLIAVHDDKLAELWSVLDLVVSHALGAILPGWRRDVRTATYLVARDDRLFRVRTRLTPASAVATHEPQPDPRSAVDWIVEGIMLLHNVHGQLRGTGVVARYGALARLRVAALELLRSTIAVGVPGPNWTGMDTELARTPTGRRCLVELRELLAAPPPETPRHLSAITDCFLRIAEHAAPAVMSELAGPVDSFRQYLRIGEPAPLPPAPVAPP